VSLGQEARAVSEVCCELGKKDDGSNRPIAAPMADCGCPPECRAAEFVREHWHRQCSKCGRIWLLLTPHRRRRGRPRREDLAARWRDH
jgi:hypothetical protein